MSKLLATTEAARIAGVTPSSIKRWADQNLLSCVKTPGGHRRFEKVTLERFLREQSLDDSEGPSPTEELVELLITDAHHAIVSHLFQLMQERGAWCHVADAVGPVLKLIGGRWHQGDLTIAEEHIASDALSRALSFVASSMPVNRRGKQYLLAVVAGDQHDLDLRLVELCLRARQWRPVWLGQNTPCDVLVERIASSDAEMVARSASSYSARAETLEGIERRVARACLRTGANLVLGGLGAWPESPDDSRRITSFSPFDELLIARP